MLAPLGIFLGLGVLGYAAAHHASTLATLRGLVAAPPPEDGAPPRVEGLEPGADYRIWAKLESGYGAASDYDTLKRDLEQKVLALGFETIHLSGEDPTDASVWTILARWGAFAGDGFDNAPPLGVYAVERVEVPAPKVGRALTVHVLDPDMTFDQALAVDVALTDELDPQALVDFSKAMAVDFPVSQSLLRSKADALSRGATGQYVVDALVAATRRPPSLIDDRPPVALAAVNKSVSMGYMPTVRAFKREATLMAAAAKEIAGTYAADRPATRFDEYGGEYLMDPLTRTVPQRNEYGLPLSYLPHLPPAESWASWRPVIRNSVPELWSGDVYALYGDMLDRANAEAVWVDLYETWLVPDSVLITLNHCLIRLRSCGLPKIQAGACGVKVTTTVTRFDPDAIVDAFAQVLRAIASVVSFIPGLGTVASMALNAAAAIALGEPLDEALIGTIAAALPGGPLARDAFKSAAAFAGALVQGKDLDEAALEAARSAASSVGGPLALAAFDAGIALARGQALQAAGFKLLYAFARGTDLVERAAHFAEAQARAVAQNLPIKEILTSDLLEDLIPLGSFARETQLGQAISAVLENAELLGEETWKLAERLGVPEAVARAAQAAITRLDDGSLVVDQALVTRLKPKVPVSTLASVKVASTYAYEKAAQKEAKLMAGAAIAVSGPSYTELARPRDLAPLVTQMFDKAKAGEQAAIEAQAAVERAARLLARQHWVDHYLTQHAGAAA